MGAEVGEASFKPKLLELRDRCQTATSDPELKEKAQQFVEATEEVKQPFTNLLQTLKTGVEKFKEALDEVVQEQDQEGEVAQSISVID